MTALNPETAQRLARGFLTGRISPAELEDLKSSIEGDPNLALELLRQMGSALDGVPPAGFSPDQWKEVDGRVATLIKPLARSRLGILGRIFGGLFGRSAPPAAAPAPPRSKRHAAPVPEPAPAPPPAGEGGEGLEEMAPIAPAPAAAPAPPAPVAPEAEPEEAPAAASSREPRRFPRAALGTVVGLLLAAGLAWAWMHFDLGARLKARFGPKPTPLPTPAPTPVPTPTPRGAPQRALPPAPPGEPLPSEIGPATPQPAGQVLRQQGLEAQGGGDGETLPLPAP